MQKQLKLFKDCGSPCMVFAEVTDSVQGDPITPLSKRPRLNKDDWKLQGNIGTILPIKNVLENHKDEMRILVGDLVIVSLRDFEEEKEAIFSADKKKYRK